MQDDCAPVANFVPALQRIAASNPANAVCLFLPPYVREKGLAQNAMKTGLRYITLNAGSQSFVPVVGVLWPRALAVEFYEWAQAHPQLPGQREPRSDDAMCGYWKTRTRQAIRATVPSIVEHLGREPSIAQSHDKGERFALFLAEDALAYEW